MADDPLPLGYERRGRRSAGRFARAVGWLFTPWGQLAAYLAVFAVLGFALAAFFGWVRGPVRPPYVPFNP
jgi:hypothetical protein